MSRTQPVMSHRDGPTRRAQYAAGGAGAVKRKGLPTSDAVRTIRHRRLKVKSSDKDRLL